MTSADVLEAKGWSVSVYGRHAESEPIVKLTNEDAIQIPLSGGGDATVFSVSNTEIEMEQEYDAVVAAIRFRPRDGLTYKIKAGVVQDYSLEYSSGTHANKFSSTHQGWIWGLGLEWNVLPGTIVTPAMTVDGSFTQMQSGLDRFQAPQVNEASDIRIVQDEFQLALNVSKRFKTWEPFGGLKVNRVVSRLRDDTNKQKIQGTHDGWSPFVGPQWEMFPGEMVVVEGSFADEKSVNAGLKINF